MVVFVPFTFFNYLFMKILLKIVGKYVEIILSLQWFQK